MTRLRYFAWLRENIGTAEEELELPTEIGTVAGLITWLRGRGPGHAAAFAETNRVRCALDHEFAGPDAPIGQAREIGFFPPVTGG